MRETFWPTPWCFNHVAQLVRIELAKRAQGRARADHASFRRQLLPTRDGGVVALDWLLDDGSEGDSGGDSGGDADGRVADASAPAGWRVSHHGPAPVCLFLHTITATVDDQYGMRVLLEQGGAGTALRCTYAVGMGGCPSRRAGSPWWESQRTWRWRWMLRDRHTHARVVLIGCSAGSNSLMRYLGDRPAEARRAGVVAAVAVCPGVQAA